MLQYKIYEKERHRTDEMGEVVLKTNGKGLKFIPFIK